MSIQVLGISGSPRVGGNSERLLAEALAGAAAAGADCEQVDLRGLTIGPCVSCGACQKTGRCVFQDDFTGVYEKMIAADRIVFATPIYFMAVSAQAKLLIDRCQCLWSEKYILKSTPAQRLARDLRGMVIAVGGCASTKMFESIRMTMKYYFDVLNVHYTYSLWVNRIDARGEILEHGEALAEARRLGGRLVSGPRPRPEAPSKRVLLIGGERAGGP